MIVLLILGSVLAFSQEYKLIEKVETIINKNIIGLITSDDQLFFETIGGKIIDNKSQKEIEISLSKLKYDNLKNKNIDLRKFKYISEVNGTIIGCIYDSTYASRFVKIDPSNGKETFFSYVKGIPSGMCSYNNKLWYLSNKSGKNADSILRSYSLENFQIETEIVIPINCAKGLAFKDGSFITYENISKSVVFFSIKEK